MLSYYLTKQDIFRLEYTVSGLHTAGDRVVLLDDSGAVSGSAQKERIHSSNTPLHLAFSCHIVNSAGEVLVTRRALSKRSWPGVWTNSFCGHPQPDELLTDAIVRHAATELGLGIDPVENGLILELPDFRYRAIDASGIVENELCPVYRAHSDDPVQPNPAEVMEFAWVQPAALAQSIRLTPWAFSPWLVLQAEALSFLNSENSSPTEAAASGTIDPVVYEAAE